MSGAGGNPPRPHGDRLGVVVGHSLPAAAFADAERRTVTVDRPGSPAVDLLETAGAVVLLRHGLDRGTPAHRVDHHAHVAALCAAGVGRVVGLGSVGALRREWPPGTVVCPDDFFAPHVTPTFETGPAGHRVPGLDAGWRAEVLSAWRAVSDHPVHDGGVYAHVTGPRFETPAEIRFLATVADVVGMTLAAEAFLAGEVGLRYAPLCVVDNLANGLDDEPLTVARYQEQKAANEALVAAALGAIVERLAAGRGTG